MQKLEGDQSNQEFVVNYDEELNKPNSETLKELQAYLHKTCTKDVCVPEEVCYDLLLTGVTGARERKLKPCINAEFVLIISADTSLVGVDENNILCAKTGDGLQKLELKGTELPKIHFKVVAFSQTRMKEPPVEIVVSLAELLHLIRMSTLDFFFGTF
jgi:hypothetical protein